MAAGSIIIDLLLRTGSFETDTKRAEKAMQGMSKTAFAVGTAMGQFLHDGIVAVARAIPDMINAAIDAADQMRDLSIRTGASTETLSKWAYAARQTGTDIEGLSRGLKLLSKNATEALDPKSQQAGLFKALGVSRDALSDLEKLVPAVADAFKKLPDGPQKAAVAMELFGKSGSDLVEFLDQGSKGLDEFGDKAERLGIVISSQTADAADKFKDDLDDLKSASMGLAMQVAGELLPVLDDIVKWAQEFIADGTNAKEIAADLAATLDGVAAAGDAIGHLIGIIGELRDVLAQADKASQWLATFGGTAPGRGTAIKDMLPAWMTRDWLGGDAGNTSKAAGPFDNVRSRVDTVSGAAPNAALDRYFATGGRTPKGSSGKSDAERQAERVARAIEQMTKAQQDWENELKKTGEPIVDSYNDHLREITEQAAEFAKEGVPAGKVAAFTEEMKKLAEQMRDADLAKFQKEFTDETATMAAQMAGPAAAALEQYRQDVAALDEQLAHGVITIDQYNDRLSQLGKLRDSPATDVLSQLQEQIDMLGMTNKEQFEYNMLKQAGVSATSDFRQQIAGLADQLYDLQEQTRYLDDVRDALADTFVDFISGAKSAKEAFGDFADYLFKRSLQMLADKALENLFKGFGSSGSGSTDGGGWGSLLSAIGGLFGGGKAIGGDVSSGTAYLVGEQGPELFVPRTAGAIVPAGATAAAMSGGGTFFQNNTFLLPRRVDNRSQMQISQAAGNGAADAIRRNGG